MTNGSMKVPYGAIPSTDQTNSTIVAPAWLVKTEAITNLLTR